MPVDYAKLGESLTSANLTGKPVNNYSREEVDALVRACIESMVPDKGATFTKPFIAPDGELVIPFDSDPKYHWWRPCGQSVFETLRELKASDEVWGKYVDTADKPF
jgi:hypothetical protein